MPILTTKEIELNRLKSIFLESGVSYKGYVLTDKNISLGQVPSIPTTPHINISWSPAERTPTFTGVGDTKLNNYNLSFILRPAKSLTTPQESVLKEITDDLNNFIQGYLDYLFDNYRYETWFYISQIGQSTPLRLENNNFTITITLQTKNY